MNEQKIQLGRYAELKAEINRLTDELELLKPSIAEFVEEQNPDDKAIESDYGVFKLVGRRVYTYPTRIVNEEAKLKEAKKECEATGEATYEMNYSLRFDPVV